MKIFIGLVLFIAVFLDLTFVIISDDKRVYTRLNKKELYRLSIIKDILNAIIIISLALLPFF
jgi:hypothetical protein